MTARSRPKRRPRRLAGSRGFTLLELTVALAVTGLAVAGGYAAFTSLLDTRGRADDAMRAAARASAIRSTLVSWLEGARVTADRSAPQFRGLGGEHMGSADASLTLLTTGRTPLDVAQAVVSLSVDRDPATPEEGLVAAIGEWRGPRSTRLTVAPEVRGLEARYLTRVNGEPQWLESWISSTLLPDAIELRLLDEPDAPLPDLLQLPILVVFRGGG